MVSKLFIPELIFCIVVVVAYYGYYVFKYRKAPKAFVLAAWGVGAYFLFNAFSNALLLIFVQIIGSETANSLALNNSVLLMGIQSVLEALSLIFISGFIIKQMNNRRQFVGDNSANMTGYIMGAGSLFTPFLPNSLLMVFVQGVINVAVLISNPTGAGIEGVSSEDFAAIKDLYVNLPNGYFISMLLNAIIVAATITLIFKFLYATYDNSNMKDKLLAGAFYCIVVLVGIYITYLFNNTIIQILIRLAMITSLMYIFKSFDKLVNARK